MSALALLTVLLLAGTAGAVWWVARGDARPVSDAIIVLGAAQFDGRPSSVLEARLQHARTLFEQGIAPRVLTVGGGRAGDRTTEAQAGAAFLQERGVRTLPVPRGRNTLESLQAAEQVMRRHGWTSAVVVTDPWHSLRARTMARDLGLTAVSSPTRSGPSVRSRGTQLHYIARETLALMAYELLGRRGPGALGS